MFCRVCTCDHSKWSKSAALSEYAAPCISLTCNSSVTIFQSLFRGQIPKNNTQTIITVLCSPMLLLRSLFQFHIPIEKALQLYLMVHSYWRSIHEIVMNMLHLISIDHSHVPFNRQALVGHVYMSSGREVACHSNSHFVAHHIHEHYWWWWQCNAADIKISCCGEWFFNRFEYAMLWFGRTKEKPGPLSKNWSNLTG